MSTKSNLESKIEELQGQVGDLEQERTELNGAVDRQASRAVRAESNLRDAQHEINSLHEKLGQVSAAALATLMQCADEAGAMIRTMTEQHIKDVRDLQTAHVTEINDLITRANGSISTEEARTEATWGCFRYVADLLAGRDTGCSIDTEH